LLFDKNVWRIGPTQDLAKLIVENEIALVGTHRKYRVTFIVLVTHDSDQQCALRPTERDKPTTLF
jgi:hypothetical protein